MSQRKSLVLTCLAFSALPLLAGCSQGGGDSAAIAASPPSGITGSVTVVNTPDNPVPVTITDQAGALASFTSCIANSPGADILTVPSGKQAVIEYVSSAVQVNAAVTGIPHLRLFGIVSGRPFAFYSVAQGLDGSGFKIYVISQPTRIYAPPGTTLHTEVENGGSPGGNVCISGHFEAAAS